MKVVFLALLLSAAPVMAAQHLLSGHAEELYRQSEHERRFPDTIRPRSSVLPTSDGKSFLVVWKGTPKPSRWIVSLHGTQGYAIDDLALWFPQVYNRDVGVVSLQWWLGDGDGHKSYYTPAHVYREIDGALRQLGVEPGSVMLHGFSRGAASSYAVAALDAARGRRYFSLVVASSGGVDVDYPPVRSLLRGDFGARPLQGTRWITAAGGTDPDPDRDGIPAMRRTAEWLEEQGATVVGTIEDPVEGHGALQRNPANAKRLLDLFTSDIP